jgi:predicted O-methyltransferase YrrM
VSILRRIKALVRPRGARGVKIAKASARAKAVQQILGRSLSLEKRTKQITDEIRSRMAADTSPFPETAFPKYSTVGEHFCKASSGDSKLALLSALVRLHEAKSILEVGTGYGLSALTMALSQRVPQLSTIDYFEPQATIGAANILANSSQIECIKAPKEEALPRLANGDRRFDFVFHDGGHDGDAYVSDFEVILPCLEKGSIYIIDDIGWDDGSKRQFTRARSRRTCREGWLELLRHSRVDGALEFEGRTGILLLTK